MNARKMAAASLVAVSFSAALVACESDDHTACAATLKGSSSAGKSGGGGGSSSGGKSGGVSKPAAPPPKAPSAPSGAPNKAGPNPPAYPAGGGAPRPEVDAKGKPVSPPSRSDAEVIRARAAASRPSAKPDPADVSTARSYAPGRVTRGGVYESPVTHVTYVYHDTGWYRSPGYLVDIWDPYDRFNYWYRPASPFYGRPFLVADACRDDAEGREEPKQNVTINVNSEGKVTEVRDLPGTPGTTPGPTPGSVPPAVEPTTTLAVTQ